MVKTNIQRQKKPTACILNLPAIYRDQLLRMFDVGLCIPWIDNSLGVLGLVLEDEANW